MVTSTSTTGEARAGAYSSRILWRRWVVATTLGELVGFIAPTLAGVIITQVVVGMDSPFAPLLTMIVLVMAGSLEGAALGYAQWRVLRGALPALRWQAWTGATALAGVVAWILGMLPNTVIDALGMGAEALAVAWAMAAPGVLLSIGVAQWLVLRHHVRHVALWVPANALGWGLGVSATVLGASLVNETMALWAAVTIGVASGVTMGLIVGCITGLALVRMLRRL